jgi:hypothetical protein
MLPLPESQIRKEHKLKYLVDGSAVEVVEELTSGFLVQSYYSYGDDEEPYLDRTGIKIVDRVFDTPPVAKFHESIQRLNDEIDQLKQTKANLLAEQKAYQKDIEEASAKRKQHEQLRLLDDFIDGKITHYVEFYWNGEPNIVEFQDAKCGYDRKKLKLLTLFGDSNGNLEWKLSAYSDGSGCSSTVVPTTSYEQAVEVAKSHITDLLQDAKRSAVQSTVNIADKWGVPVPDDYRKQAKATERDRLLKALNERDGQVTEIKSKIAELDK